MRQTVRKWYWAWDYDKEEKWLNEMSAKGLALVGVGFCRYTFEETIPGEYGVRLDMLEHFPSHPESQKYIKFVEETGAEYLGSITKWVFFRKKLSGGEFRLYSDTAALILHLNRLLTLLGVLSLMNLAIGSANVLIHFNEAAGENLLGGLINLSLGMLASYGFMRILIKKRRLKKERSLFE